MHGKGGIQNMQNQYGGGYPQQYGGYMHPYQMMPYAYYPPAGYGYNPYAMHPQHPPQHPGQHPGAAYGMPPMGPYGYPHGQQQ